VSLCAGTLQFLYIRCWIACTLYLAFQEGRGLLVAVGGVAQSDTVVEVDARSNGCCGGGGTGLQLEHAVVGVHVEDALRHQVLDQLADDLHYIETRHNSFGVSAGRSRNSGNSSSSGSGMNGNCDSNSVAHWS